MFHIVLCLCFRLRGVESRPVARAAAEALTPRDIVMILGVKLIIYIHILRHRNKTTTTTNNNNNNNSSNKHNNETRGRG